MVTLLDHHQDQLCLLMVMEVAMMMTLALQTRMTLFVGMGRAIMVAWME